MASPHRTPLHTVFVTGATGFIASHIVAGLLAGGHRVRGSVRHLQRTAAFLRELPGARDRLELVEADLVDPHAFDGLIAGCDIVVHSASPYVLDAADPQRDLIDPAVNGTRALLRACAATPSVTRVVLTSSFAAVTDEPDEGHVLTEHDWNERSTIDRNPYYLSKTLAERAAWSFVESVRPRWDLVAIHPFLVIGPSLSPALNTSNKLIADLLNGSYPAMPAMAWGVVDVRDVADAHIRAIDAEAARGRYLCAGETVRIARIVNLLRTSGYGGYRLPRFSLTGPVGNTIAKLGARLQSKGARQYLLTHIGRVPRFDNSKIRRDLGVTFRPADQTILDAAADLVRWGHVAPRRSSRRRDEVRDRA